MISYHAGIFRALVANGELRNEDPDTLAWMYVSPIIVLLSICDRQPEREAESLEKLDAHVKLFFRTFNIVGGENKGIFEFWLKQKKAINAIIKGELLKHTTFALGLVG